MGCCPSCNGSGFSGDDAVPGGLCWDCQGTGHAHAGRCVRRDWFVIVVMTIVILVQLASALLNYTAYINDQHGVIPNLAIGSLNLAVLVYAHAVLIKTTQLERRD